MTTTKIIKTFFLLFVAAVGTGMIGTNKLQLTRDATESPVGGITVALNQGTPHYFAGRNNSDIPRRTDADVGRFNNAGPVQNYAQKDTKYMLIKTTKKPANLVPEGEYDPIELKEVGYKNEGKKAVLNFGVNHGGKLVIVPKEDPTSLDSGPLRKDMEILNSVPFTPKQIEDGIELEKFIGRKCRALVIHKRTSGGKTVAVVNVLMPLAAKPAPPAAAAPEQSAVSE
jgi:hypothetical protein